MVTSSVTSSRLAPAWSGHFTVLSGAAKSCIPDSGSLPGCWPGQAGPGLEHPRRRPSLDPEGEPVDTAPGSFTRPGEVAIPNRLTGEKENARVLTRQAPPPQLGAAQREVRY